MFDLSKYMTAEERIELFAHHYPVFRMSSSHETVTDPKSGTTFIVVKIAIYKDYEDKMPWVVGLAAENIMTPFAIEKAETSAYARAITNTGDPLFSTTKSGAKAPRPNREEMIKVAEEQNNKELEALQKPVVKMEAEWDNWVKDAESTPNFQESIQVVTEILGAREIPECAHGFMEHKSGKNKEGKPYSGYVCPSKNRNDQCKPKWDK